MTPKSYRLDGHGSSSSPSDDHSGTLEDLSIKKRQPLSKRRNRVTVVCNVCKYRKVRCDRKQPCTSCVRYNSSELCSYNVPKWDEKVAIEKLAQINANNALKYSKQPTETPRKQDATSTVRRKGSKEELSDLKQKIVHLQSLIEGSESTRSYESSETSESPSSLKKEYNRAFLLSARLTGLLSSFSTFDAVAGINPISSPDETINFFEGYTPICVDPQLLETFNHGPFSWHCIIRKDCALSDLWNFIHSRRSNVDPKYKATSLFSSEQDSRSPNSPFSVLQRIKSYLLSKFDPDNYSVKLKNLPLGLTFNNNCANKESSLKDRITEILPSPFIIWAHIDRFFKFLYPFYPFLDEIEFRNSISAMISSPDNDLSQASVLKITRKVDYAIIGLLFVLMRLSYISLISNTMEVNEQNIKSNPTTDSAKEIKTLLLNPIGIEFIDMSRNCLNEFQLFHRTSLEVLQLALYLRLYMFSAPEDSEGPTKNQFQIYNGLLIQMGYSLGLNREPDNFPDILNNPRINNVRRKIWFHLYYMDIIHSIKFGNPYAIGERFVDTKFPLVDLNNENCLVKGMDRFVIDAMKPMETIVPLVKQILKLVLEVKERVPMSMLTAKLSKLETRMLNEYGTIKDFVHAFNQVEFNDQFVKTIQIHRYLALKYFLLSIYFHFFLHYEAAKEFDLMFFYLKKILAIITEECLQGFYELLDKPHFYFQEAAHLSVNPCIQMMLHKSNIFFFSLITRLGYTIRSLKANNADESTIGNFEHLQRLVIRSSKLCIIGISKLSHRHCSAWRASNSHSFILRNIVQDDYYKTPDSKTKELLYKSLQLTNDQVMDLITYIEKPLKGFDIKDLTKDWKAIRDVVDAKSGEINPTASDNKPNISFSINRSDCPLADIEAGQLENGQSTKLFDNNNTPKAGAYSIDSWPPLTNLQQDLNNAMESFFDLQDPYLDIFNDLALTQVFDGFGNE